MGTQRPGRQEVEGPEGAGAKEDAAWGKLKELSHLLVFSLLFIPSIPEALLRAVSALTLPCVVKPVAQSTGTQASLVLSTLPPHPGTKPAPRSMNRLTIFMAAGRAAWVSLWDWAPATSAVGVSTN